MLANLFSALAKQFFVLPKQFYVLAKPFNSNTTCYFHLANSFLWKAECCIQLAYRYPKVAKLKNPLP